MTTTNQQTDPINHCPGNGPDRGGPGVKEAFERFMSLSTEVEWAFDSATVAAACGNDKLRLILREDGGWVVEWDNWPTDNFFVTIPEMNADDAAEDPSLRFYGNVREWLRTDFEDKYEDAFQ